MSALLKPLLLAAQSILTCDSLFKELEIKIIV